jgi:hypothetical protein
VHYPIPKITIPIKKNQGRAMQNDQIAKKSREIAVIIGLFRKYGILDKYFSGPVKLANLQPIF